MTEKELLFEEKQYLGYNKFSIIRRMTLAIFCFITYYFSAEDSQVSFPKVAQIEGAGDLFFIMGIAILVLSGLLIFVLHIKTQVYAGSLIIDGLWTSRKVKIDLSVIRKIQVVKYSKYLLNRPVYNLHWRGKIRFFTRGNDAIELTDKDGLIYLLGSQQAKLLHDVIKSQINPQTT